MKAYEECEKANKEFGRELRDFMKKHPNLTRTFNYKPQTNPFDYSDRFHLECEKTFVPFIIFDKYNKEDPPEEPGMVLFVKS